MDGQQQTAMTPQHLFLIIGQKEVELQLLRSSLQTANERIAGLESQLNQIKNKKGKEKTNVKK